MLVATDKSIVVAYINKEGRTREDVRSPVEDHDLVPSLPDNLKSLTHPRVSECDGRPSVQVKPSPVKRMVTASTGVQTDMSQVVHSSCRSICHKVPLYVSPVPDQNAWDIDALNINWSGLTAYSYPPIPSSYLIIVITPGWPGVPWFWDLVQLSAEIPLPTTSIKNSSQTVPNYVFHCNPQHLNLHAWCLGVDSSKNKASLWRWQRELRRLRGSAEKIWLISPLPL